RVTNGKRSNGISSGSQHCVWSDADGTGDASRAAEHASADQRSSGIGISAVEEQYPIAELGQTAVASAINQRRKHSDGITAIVDDRLGGLDHGVDIRLNEIG